MEPVTPDPLISRLDDLEKHLNNLTREVLLLRQELPNSHDRLREQLATVRLSHSGLLQDLRRRVQALEVATNPEVDSRELEQQTLFDPTQSHPAPDSDPSPPEFNDQDTGNQDTGDLNLGKL
jgi:hypothetical protein